MESMQGREILHGWINDGIEKPWCDLIYKAQPIYTLKQKESTKKKRSKEKKKKKEWNEIKQETEQKKNGDQKYHKKIYILSKGCHCRETEKREEKIHWKTKPILRSAWVQRGNPSVMYNAALKETGLGLGSVWTPPPHTCLAYVIGCVRWEEEEAQIGWRTLGT